MTAAELCRHVRLRGPSWGLLREDLSPPEFVDLLEEHGRWADALRFLPHAIPKRAAVWWGCLCAWDVLRGALSEQADAALAAAVRRPRNVAHDYRRFLQLGLEVAAGRNLWTSTGLPAEPGPAPPQPAIDDARVAEDDRRDRLHVLHGATAWPGHVHTPGRVCGCAVRPSPEKTAGAAARPGVDP